MTITRKALVLIRKVYSGMPLSHLELLERAEFGGQPLPAQQVDQLVAEAQALLNQVNSLAK